MEAELLNVNEAAAMIGCSARHVWSLSHSGLFPRPVRLGRAVRWNRAELSAWIAAGCPRRDKWEALRDGAGEKRTSRS